MRNRAGGAARLGASLAPPDGDADSNNSDGGRPLPFASIILPLLLISISSQWVRSTLYYLVDFSAAAPSDPAALADLSRTAMNVDLNFNVEQYGLLASAAFTSLFALASLLAGVLTDRHDRRALAVGSCLAWSAATLGMASAGTYEEVLAMRALTGLACAFAAPAGYTLLRDLVPRERSGMASSTYGAGVYLGESMASLSILTDSALGWRGSLGVAGWSGVAAAIGAGLALPPDRAGKGAKQEMRGRHGGEEAGGDRSDLLADAYDVLATDRARWLFLAVFFRFCAGFLIGVWSAPYFKLAFPDDSSSFAVVNAVIVGACGVTSGLVGGAASDWFGVEAPLWGKKGEWDESSGRLIVPFLGAILAIPVWYAVVSARTFDEAMVWLAIKYLVAECWFGPAIAVLQATVPSRLGGTAQGMFTLTSAMGNLAPTSMGVLFCWATDAAAGSLNDSGTQAPLLGVGDGRAEILAGLLGGAVCGAYLLSGVCFALCARSVNPPLPAAEKGVV